MSTREIALALGLTLLACAFVLAAMLAPGQQDAIVPAPSATASDSQSKR